MHIFMIGNKLCSQTLLENITFYLLFLFEASFWNNKIKQTYQNLHIRNTAILKFTQIQTTISNFKKKERKKITTPKPMKELYFVSINLLMILNDYAQVSL